jgi:hypothetical protein
MFKSFHCLYNWLHSNGIEKPVSIRIMTDMQTANHIGRLLRDEANALIFGQPFSEPIREGQIYGITFRIEVGGAPS